MRNYDDVLTDLQRIGDRTHHHKIVSTLAFLAGVSEEGRQERDPHFLCYESLYKEKHARIIRNLCRARTIIYRSYKDLEARSKAGVGLYASEDIMPPTILTELEMDGALFIKKNSTKPSEHLMEINKLIKARISNCQHLFPEWLNWNYIRSLFVIEDGDTYQGSLAAAKTFYSNSRMYPYGVFINWEPEDYKQNILYNDLTFLIILYAQHDERFKEYEKVSDIKQSDKDAVHDFVDRDDKKIVMMVDCENSDPYRLSAVLRGLNAEQLQKMKKIYLFDDVHTTPAWKKLHLYTEIPIEHKMIERINDRKSMVDMSLGMEASKEYYTGNANAFIVVSSDSDYWTLMKSLPEADFLVLAERHKCGTDLRRALEDREVFYCYIDDFYSGHTDMQRVMINQSLRETFSEKFKLNLKEEFDRILTTTRIWMNDTEKAKAYKKLVKGLCIQVEDDGEMKIEATV